MIGRIAVAFFVVIIVYFCVLIASGFIDFALQWFIDFRLRPYILIPLFWLFGVIGGIINGIVNAILSPHAKAVLGFSLVISSISIAPHLFFRFIILPMQISRRWLVISIYVATFAFCIGYRFYDRSIWDIFISALVNPISSSRFTDGIVRVLSNEFSIAFLLAMTFSQTIGYLIVRKIRYLKKFELPSSAEALNDAGDVMELTTLLGKRMGYIKTNHNSENIIHWAMQKGNQIAYPFFPGLSGSSPSGHDASIDSGGDPGIDFDL